MSQFPRIGAGLGALALAALTACPVPSRDAGADALEPSCWRTRASAATPWRSCCRATATRRRRFVRHGFVAELEAAGVDVILADAHSGYYAEQSTEERL